MLNSWFQDSKRQLSGIQINVAAFEMISRTKHSKGYFQHDQQQLLGDPRSHEHDAKAEIPSTVPQIPSKKNQ
jgi:hypothetical protein